ncbi:hypothetical protein [Sanguibacter sp. HDW7]|uniref:hypothetical protein n=1 Tax=Sanguibacter sp. HDW7 TaxID=2714931 RepID=UPI0014090009|nr:hypothetical protein [Sanguibacter sp. HDW7]QIK82792.1 hypothetical protein G7063_03505 [Sanguibacter sp. HDW7]
MPSARRGAALLVAIVLSAVATGCTADSPTPTAAPTAPTGGASTSTVWDPMSWEPTVRIEPIAMTEAEKLAWRQEQITDEAHHLGYDPVPEVALVRWTTSNVDWATAVAECLTDAGFPATPDKYGGILSEELPEAQEAANSRAHFTCNAKYTTDPVISQEWTNEQLGLTYDYWEQYFIPCMAAHGIEVDQSKKPTREAYIAAFHTPERLDWWPNGALEALPPEKRDEIAPQCPSYVPAAFFFGS